VRRPAPLLDDAVARAPPERHGARVALGDGQLAVAAPLDGREEVAPGLGRGRERERAVVADGGERDAAVRRRAGELRGAGLHGDGVAAAQLQRRPHGERAVAADGEGAEAAPAQAFILDVVVGRRDHRVAAPLDVAALPRRGGFRKGRPRTGRALRQGGHCDSTALV
jgi:hypothetical protein